VRSMPFMPLYPILGPAGERWVPLHGILPFSQIAEFHKRLMAQHDKYGAKMNELGITNAAMFMTVSTHAFLYEPVFYWKDARHIYHKRYLPKDFLKMVPEYPENVAARTLVEEMREGIRGLFQSVGAVHLQVGKSYPYMKGRDARNAEVLKAIKSALDPSHLMNPGSLGL